MKPLLYLLVLLPVTLSAIEKESRYRSKGESRPSQLKVKSDIDAEIQKKFQRVRRAAKAEAQSGTTQTTQTSSRSTLALGLQVLFGLAFVLTLLVFSIRGLKKLQRMKMFPAKGDGEDLLEILETCHVGNQQKIVALRVNNEVCLLGVGSQSITHLMDVGPHEIVEQKRSKNPVVFKENLDTMLSRFKRPKNVGEILNQA